LESKLIDSFAKKVGGIESHLKHNRSELKKTLSDTGNASQKDKSDMAPASDKGRRVQKYSSLQLRGSKAFVCGEFGRYITVREKETTKGTYIKGKKTQGIRIELCLR